MNPRDLPRPLESIWNHVFEKKKFLKKNFIFTKISKYLECTPETSRDLPRPPETFREHLESFLKNKNFLKKILFSQRLANTLNVPPRPPETSRDLLRPPETFRKHLESCFGKIKIFEKKNYF